MIEVARAKSRTRNTRSKTTLHHELARELHQDTEGQRLDFKRYHKPFVEILKDDHHLIAVEKAVQIGFTGSVLEPLFFASMFNNQRVFYVLPDGTLRDSFVHDRIDPLLGSIPAYASLIVEAESRLSVGRSPADAVAMKQLGKTTVFFVASNSGASFRLHAADRAIVDEYDDCNQINLSKVNGRLKHSKLAHRIDVGNPTLDGFGIDGLYQDSDRRVWEVPCPHCGDWQSLDWYKNVVEELDEGVWTLRSTGDRTDDPDVRKNPKSGSEPSIVCRYCGGDLDRYADGRWTVTNPGVDRHGYRISQLECGPMSIRDMWAEFVNAVGDESKLQVFINDTLGHGFDSKGSKLSLPMLKRIVGTFPASTTADLAFMGIDVGAMIHVVVIDELRKMIATEVFPCNKKTVDRLSELMDQFNAYAAIDAGPERSMSIDFAERWEGRAFRVEFKRSDSPGDIYELREDEQLIKPDRTQFMDATHKRIVTGTFSLHRGALSIPDFGDHMIAPTRVFVPAKSGSPTRGRFVWDEGSRADHYRFAFGYADLILDVYQEIGDPQIGVI